MSDKLLHLDRNLREAILQINPRDLEDDPKELKRLVENEGSLPNFRGKYALQQTRDILAAGLSIPDDGDSVAMLKRAFDYGVSKGYFSAEATKNVFGPNPLGESSIPEKSPLVVLNNPQILGHVHISFTYRDGREHQGHDWLLKYGDIYVVCSFVQNSAKTWRWGVIKPDQISLAQKLIPRQSQITAEDKFDVWVKASGPAWVDSLTFTQNSVFSLPFIPGPKRFEIEKALEGSQFKFNGTKKEFETSGYSLKTQYAPNNSTLILTQPKQSGSIRVINKDTTITWRLLELSGLFFLESQKTVAGKEEQRSLLLLDATKEELFNFFKTSFPTNPDEIRVAGDEQLLKLVLTKRQLYEGITSGQLKEDGAKGFYEFKGIKIIVHDEGHSDFGEMFVKVPGDPDSVKTLGIHLHSGKMPLNLEGASILEEIQGHSSKTVLIVISGIHILYKKNKQADAPHEFIFLYPETVEQLKKSLSALKKVSIRDQADIYSGIGKLVREKKVIYFNFNDTKSTHHIVSDGFSFKIPPLIENGGEKKLRDWIKTWVLSVENPESPLLKSLGFQKEERVPLRLSFPKVLFKIQFKDPEKHQTIFYDLLDYDGIDVVHTVFENRGEKEERYNIVKKDGRKLFKTLFKECPLAPSLDFLSAFLIYIKSNTWPLILHEFPAQQSANPQQLPDFPMGFQHMPLGILTTGPYPELVFEETATPSDLSREWGFFKQKPPRVSFTDLKKKKSREVAVDLAEGLFDEPKSYVAQIDGAKIIGEKVGSAYLAYLDGIHFIYLKNSDGEANELYFLPPEEAKKPLNFTPGLRGLFGAKLSHPSQAHTLVIEPYQMKIEIPAEDSAFDDYDFIKRIKLTLYDPKAEVLEKLGYKKENVSELRQTEPLVSLAPALPNGFYRAGKLLLVFKKEADVILVFRDDGPHVEPVVVLKRQGAEFMIQPETPHAESLKGFKVILQNTHPGEDVLKSAKLQMPLIPTLTKAVGVPFEYRYPLKFIRDENYEVAEGSLKLKFYQAGPFLMVETFEPLLYARMLEIFPRGITIEDHKSQSDRLKTFLKTLEEFKGISPRTISLLADDYESRHIVPVSRLHPALVKLYVENVNQIPNPELRDTFLMSFALSSTLSQLQGLSVVTLSDVTGNQSLENAVLVIHPTDALQTYLNLNGQVNFDTGGGPLEVQPKDTAEAPAIYSHDWFKSYEGPGALWIDGWKFIVLFPKGSKKKYLRQSVDFLTLDGKGHFLIGSMMFDSEDKKSGEAQIYGLISKMIQTAGDQYFKNPEPVHWDKIFYNNSGKGTLVQLRVPQLGPLSPVVTFIQFTTEYEDEGLKIEIVDDDLVTTDKSIGKNIRHGLPVLEKVLPQAEPSSEVLTGEVEQKKLSDIPAVHFSINPPTISVFPEHQEPVIIQPDSPLTLFGVPITPMITANPVRATLNKKILFYPEGTRYLLSPQEDPSAFIEFPRENPLDLKSGDKISISVKGDARVYQLELQKGGGFRLLEHGIPVGKFQVNKNSISLSIGDRFSISGVLPQITVTQSLDIEGSEGAFGLGVFLDQLAFLLDRGNPLSPALIRSLRTVAQDLKSLNVFLQQEWRIFGIFEAEIDFELLDQDQWKILVKPNGKTNPDVLNIFSQAAADANQTLNFELALRTQRKPSRFVKEEIYPLKPVRDIPVAFTDPESTMTLNFESRFQDAVSNDLNLVWRNEELVLDKRNWDWGKNQSVTLEWKGISFPKTITTPSYQLKLKRDFKVTLTRANQRSTYAYIAQGSFVEYRDYELKTGETLALTFDHNGTQLSAAQLKISGKTIPLQWKKEAGDIFDFVNAVNPDDPTQKVRYRIVLGPQAENAVFKGSNLIQTKKILVPLKDAPFKFDRSLNLVWEENPDGSIFVHALDKIVNGTKERLLSNVILPPTWEENFPTEDLSLSDTITLKRYHRNWMVSTGLKMFNSGKIKIAGTKSDDGFLIQHLWLVDGKNLYPVQEIISELHPGEVRKISFHTPEGIQDYFIHIQDHEIHLDPLELPALPAGYQYLTNAESFLLTPALLDEKPDLRESRAESGLTLPLGDIKARLHQNTETLLRNIPEDEILYPSFDSLKRMREEVARLRSFPLNSKSVRIDFLGSRSGLLLQQDFIYKPGEDFPWQPVTISKNSEIDSLWNGHRMTSIYRPRNGSLSEIQPLGPGAPVFYTALVGGDANFFVLYNASRIPTVQIKDWHNRALKGFDRYVHALVDGILSASESAPKYVGRINHSLGDNGAVNVTLYEGKNSLTFSANLNLEEGSLQFPHGRTEITFFKEGHQFKAYYQGIFNQSHVLFILIQSPTQRHRRVEGEAPLALPVEGATRAPMIIKASFLPGADPVFVLLEETDLNKLPDLTQFAWLLKEDWAKATRAIKQPGGTRTFAPRSPAPYRWGSQELSLQKNDRPVEISGVSRKADASLLPYQSWNDDWVIVENITKPKPHHVSWMEEWLTGGGYDFQLLRESRLELRLAQRELYSLVEIKKSNLKGESGHQFEKSMTALSKKMDPVHLWFMNGKGTRLQVTFFPQVRGEGWNTQIHWTLCKEPKSHPWIRLRFIGQIPPALVDGDENHWVQMDVPAFFETVGKSTQKISLFDFTVSQTGIKQKLELLTLDEIPLLLDVTHREKPDRLEAGGRAWAWTHPLQRKHDAQLRLGRLSALMEEAEETYLPADKPEKISDAVTRWTLKERERLGTGDPTGREIQISYSVQESPSPQGVIPVLLSDTITIGMRNIYLDPKRHRRAEGEAPIRLGRLEGATRAPSEWQEYSFDCYRTRDHSIVLVQKDNPKIRFILSFDRGTANGGAPILRRMREFESNQSLHAFYKPHQWDVSFDVKRVYSETETIGVARVEDVSADYRATAQIPENNFAHRYFFSVDHGGVWLETHVDVLISEEGKILSMIHPSWVIEGLKEGFELDQNLMESEVALRGDLEILDKTGLYQDPSYTDENGNLLPGEVFLFINHRPPRQQGKGRTHSLVLGLTPDPQTRNYLGEKVGVSYFMYRREPGNPAKTFLPSQAKNQFGYISRSGMEPHEGYLQSSVLPFNSKELKSNRELTFIFYVKSGKADGRKKLKFHLQQTTDGEYKIEPGSFELYDFDSGEKLKTHVTGNLMVDEEASFTRFRLYHWPLKLEFYLDEQGQVPTNLDRFKNPFVLSNYSDRAALLAERSQEHLTPEALEAARELFAQTYGISSYSVSVTLPTTLNLNLPGQKWRLKQNVSLLDEIYQHEGLKRGERGLRYCWFEACLLYQSQKGADDSAETISRIITQCADQILKDEIEASQALIWGTKSERGKKAYDHKATEADNITANEAFKIYDEQHDFRRLQEALMESSNPEDQELALLLDDLMDVDDFSDQALKAFMPVDWSDIKKNRMQQKLQELLFPFSQVSNVLIPKVSDLQGWFKKFISGFSLEDDLQGDFDADLQTHHKVLTGTGFGLGVLNGLKTYMEGDTLTPVRDLEAQNDFALNLLMSAFHVFSTRDENEREIKAKQMAESLWTLSLPRGLNWNFKSKALEASSLIIKNDQKRDFFYKWAPFLPYVAHPKARERVLTVLRRGKFPDDGDELTIIKNAHERAFEEARLLGAKKGLEAEPIAQNVKQNLKIKKWLDFVEAPPTSTDQGSGGGRRKSLQELSVSDDIVDGENVIASDDSPLQTDESKSLQPLAVASLALGPMGGIVGSPSLLPGGVLKL